MWTFLTDLMFTEPYNDMDCFSFKRFPLGSPSKFCKGLLLTLSLWFGQAWSVQAQTEAAPTAQAEAAIMPWCLLGLDAEFARRHKEFLQSLRAGIQKTWLETAQPLDRYAAANKRALSLNEQQLARRIDLGKSRWSSPESHQLQPIICPIGDQIMLAVELIQSSSSHIVAGQQIFLPRALFDERGNKPIRVQVPEAEWQAALQKLLTSAAKTSGDVRRESFKLGLELMRSSHDGRQGSHLCLNALLAHSLLEKFTIPSFIGDREAVHLRKVWNIETPMLRATRALVIDWGMQAQGPQYKAQARWSEAFLGPSINAEFAFQAKLDRAESRLVPGEELWQLLNQEANSLEPKDLPQIAKLDRGWAYLDRGRSWGLEMNDRLYLDDGQRLIKGHVVGFYGAGLGLSSPRGFPIHEGAIVFIRKGQKAARVGDALRFDPTRFPTPWPAVRQPQQSALAP